MILGVLRWKNINQTSEVEVSDKVEEKDEEMYKDQEIRNPFVPHWFVMTAIIVGTIAIIAGILVPIIFRQ